MNNTAAAPTLPHFLIIGAQKCGTTWLHQQLATHAQIFMPAGKDDEFFSYLPQRPVAEYAAKFSTAREQQQVGDSCASYFWSARPGDAQPQGFNPDIAGTVRNVLGADCRLIILLKDPVARSVSAYLHHIAHGSLDCNTPIARAPGRLGVIALSRYGHHLAHWLKLFSAGQILLLPDPGSTDTTALLRHCCRFLHVDDGHTFPQPEKAVFPGLRRVDNDSGVWVAVGQRGVETLDKIRRPLPLMEHQGQHLVRLLHPAERRWVKQQLQADTEHFAVQLQASGIDTRPFEHWLTWPQNISQHGCG